MTIRKRCSVQGVQGRYGGHGELKNGRYVYTGYSNGKAMIQRMKFSILKGDEGIKLGFKAAFRQEVNKVGGGGEAQKGREEREQRW